NTKQIMYIILVFIIKPPSNKKQHLRINTVQQVVPTCVISGLNTFTCVVADKQLLPWLRMIRYLLIHMVQFRAGG
ncbi:hypothetical protein ACFL6U_32590, partial [Planctomycetota bacterium]